MGTLRTSMVVLLLCCPLLRAEVCTTPENLAALATRILNTGHASNFGFSLRDEGKAERHMFYWFLPNSLIKNSGPELHMVQETWTKRAAPML